MVATPKLPEEVLKPSPNFAIEQALDGRPFFSMRTHPYTEAIRMTEFHRLLLACFEGTGTPVKEAVAAFLRAKGLPRKNEALVYRLVSAFKASALLVPATEFRSIYTKEMAHDYLEHRKVPPEVLRWVIRQGRIRRDTRVLDLACGTGALTNELARVSRRVTGMDISMDFLQAAREDAKDKRLHARYVHESANRLLYESPSSYDVVTISQGFHWLDPFQAALGVLRVLKRTGRFIVVDTVLTLPPKHPLFEIFGTGAPLTLKNRIKRYEGLFLASTAMGGVPLRVEQHVQLLERREVGVPFARGFFSHQHLKDARVRGRNDPQAFWASLERRAAKSWGDRDLRAQMQWMGLLMSYKGA
jgi:SAM-dependent methyltransferase